MGGMSGRSTLVHTHHEGHHKGLCAPASQGPFIYLPSNVTEF